VIMRKVGAGAIAILCALSMQIALPQDNTLFQQDFESDVVGQKPSGNWYFGEQAGASCLVSDEATDIPGSPDGVSNLKFAKTQTGSGTGLTVQWQFEESAVDSGVLTISYWVYFESGQLMRFVVRGFNPWKHYMKMVVRGEWPDDVRLEFPINGAQKAVSGDAWHKLTFIVEWDAELPGVATCRFFIDDEEHPGSPAGMLEPTVYSIGSIELSTADWATAICHIDNISVEKVAPKPQIDSVARREGKLAMEWSGAALTGEITSLYQAWDPGGPWTLAQGNIESACLVNPGNATRAFYRVGSQEEPSPERKVIFDDDFESYTTSEDIEAAGGWTIINGSGAPEVTWRLWNTEGELLKAEDPDLVGMSGNYVISDSDFAESATLDEELISPIIDCAGYSKVGVEFTCNIKVYEDDPNESPQTTDLDVSVYDSDSGTWSPWSNLFTRQMVAGDWSSETPRFFSVSPFADGRSIKLRWRFHEARYDYWWAIDNVKVTGE